MELNQYLSVFIDEAKDHLQAINDHLLELEQNPDDLEIVQVIFRSAHTLKGMSATMGFEDLANLTHQMENVLDSIRNSKLQMDEAIIDVLFKSTDALEAMVLDIVQGGTGQADVGQLVEELKAIISGEQVGKGQRPADDSGLVDLELDEYQFSVLRQSVTSGMNAYYILVSVREDCVLKAARAYMVFDLLEKSGEIIKSTPSVQEIEQEQFDRQFSVFYVTKQQAEELKQSILGISEIDEVDVVALDEEKLNQMLKTRNNRSQAKPQAATDSQKERQAPESQANGGNAHLTRTIRVDIDKLDTLMNLFSELLIDRVRLEQLASEIKRTDLQETVEHMSRVSSDLQNIVLKLRMVPIENVFNRFPRMVRDVAKSLDKKVELIITGAETELDRTVIDEIGDPLVHLLRNSVDHGVEPQADRIASGKPETGHVWIRAYHSGNHVFIEIEDDGRGIDRTKVLDKAIDRGLVTPDQAGKMSDEEVYMLLFESGFSTADKISDISGRGVGLDVVKSKIESLGGVVSVESTLGKGTKFTIQLPLTLSIISAMLVRVGNEKYAIPLSSIVETASIKRDSILNIHGSNMVDYRQHVIPISDLAEVFETPRTENGTDGDECEIVIIRKGEKMAALIIDEFIGQQEIVLKSLGNYLTNLFAISGATILGDGQVALIIDTNALIK